MDSSLLPTCDACNQYIVKGTTLHHCTACGQDPGFDVCGKCYEPNVHGIHKDYINCGIFPQFNPYENTCRLCERPRVENHSRTRVALRIDVLKTFLGVDVSNDADGMPKYICKSCDQRLSNLKKKNANQMTLSEFRKTSRKVKRTNIKKKLPTENGLVSIVANSDGDKQDELVVNKKETNQSPHAMGQELVPKDTLDEADASIASAKDTNKQSLGEPLDSLELLITDVRSESPAENLEDSDVDHETPVASIHESSNDSVSDHQTRPETLESEEKLLPGESQTSGCEDISDDLKIVNVISMVDVLDEETVEDNDPQKETENKAEDNAKDADDNDAHKDTEQIAKDNAERSNTRGETEYDYHCHATISLIRKIGTNLVEFVYDEVFVEIASNTKKNPNIRNKSTTDEKEKENKRGKDKAKQTETGNNATQKGVRKEKNERSIFEVAENMIEELEKSSQSNTKQTDSATELQDPKLREVHGNNAAEKGVRKEDTERSIFEVAENMIEELAKSSRSDTKETDSAAKEQDPKLREVHGNTELAETNSDDTTSKMDNIGDDPVNGREVHDDNADAEASTSNETENKKKNSREDTAPKMNKINIEPGDTIQVQTESKEMKDDAKLVELQNEYTNSESTVDSDVVVSTPGLKRTASVLSATDNVDSSRSSVTQLSDNVVATDTSNDLDLNSEPPSKRPRLADTAAHKEIPPNVRHHDEKVEITEETIRSDASFEADDMQDGKRPFAPVQLSKGEIARSISDAQAEFDMICGDLFTELKPVPFPEKGSHTCNMCEESFFTEWDQSEHELTHIVNATSYACAICQKQLSSVHILRNHIKQEHNTDYSMFCSLCKVGFIHVNQYDLHHLHKHRSGPKSTTISTNQISVLNSQSSIPQNNHNYGQSKNPSTGSPYYGRNVSTYGKNNSHFTSRHHQSNQHRMNTQPAYRPINTGQGYNAYGHSNPGFAPSHQQYYPPARPLMQQQYAPYAQSNFQSGWQQMQSACFSGYPNNTQFANTGQQSTPNHNGYRVMGHNNNNQFGSYGNHVPHVRGNFTNRY